MRLICLIIMFMASVIFAEKNHDSQNKISSQNPISNLSKKKIRILKIKSQKSPQKKRNYRKQSNFSELVRDMFGTIQDIFLDLSSQVSDISWKIVQKSSKTIFLKNVPNYISQMYPTSISMQFEQFFGFSFFIIFMTSF